MPWNNQGGGQGGPWGSGGGKGPWGKGPQNSGQNNSPDIEDLFRRGQDRLKRAMPSDGGFGGRSIALIVLLGLVAWGLSGFYQVQTNEQGVEMRFGAYKRTTGPGLNYHLPYPIESVQTPAVIERRRVDVGLRVTDDARRAPTTGFVPAGNVALREVPQESLMLTGDENIAEITFSVFWVISDAPNYLFNVRNPESTIRALAESAMREVIGRSELQPILTQARQTTERAVQDLMQKALDEYKAGVRITEVQLQKVDPPQQVIDAFRDVQAARADQERLQNEASAYANRVVPEARGEADRILQAAEAYRQRVVSEARGQADRFTSVYNEYRRAPDVTRERMFIESMERVFAGTDKVILDPQGGNGVVPYLPLNELNRAPANTPTRNQTGAN
jgi:modulator of FtsH protease HflK